MRDYQSIIVFPILNSECSFAEFLHLKTEKQLQQCPKNMQDSVINLVVRINDKNISGLQNFRFQSLLFNFSILKNNILGLQSQNNIFSSVSDGNWIFLKPLPIGKYNISFKGGLRNITSNTSNQNDFAFAGTYGWDYKVIYHLNKQ